MEPIMKPIVIWLVILGLLCGSAVSGERPDSTLSVTTAGRTAGSFVESKDLAVKFWLQQLALSALYSNVVNTASSAEWERAMNSPSKIHCLYPANTNIGLPERQLLIFEEIVAPIPESGYPDFIFLKHGESFTRLAKYDPWLYWKLKVEVGIADKIPETISRALF
jgi:hypothetical protein